MADWAKPHADCAAPENSTSFGGWQRRPDALNTSPQTLSVDPKHLGHEPALSVLRSRRLRVTSGRLLGGGLLLILRSIEMTWAPAGGIRAVGGDPVLHSGTRVLRLCAHSFFGQLPLRLIVFDSSSPIPRRTCGALVNWMSE